MGPDHAGQILNFPHNLAPLTILVSLETPRSDAVASATPDLLGEVDRIFELRLEASVRQANESWTSTRRGPVQRRIRLGVCVHRPTRHAGRSWTGCV